MPLVRLSDLEPSLYRPSPLSSYQTQEGAWSSCVQAGPPGWASGTHCRLGRCNLLAVHNTNVGTDTIWPYQGDEPGGGLGPGWWQVARLTEWGRQASLGQTEPWGVWPDLRVHRSRTKAACDPEKAFSLSLSLF